jgi:hypothetical protein
VEVLKVMVVVEVVVVVVLLLLLLLLLHMSDLHHLEVPSYNCRCTSAANQPRTAHRHGTQLHTSMMQSRPALKIGLVRCPSGRQ